MFGAWLAEEVTANSFADKGLPFLNPANEFAATDALHNPFTASYFQHRKPLN